MIAAGMGIILGLAIGMGCRWFDIPLPAPPKLVGALLVVAMTTGFVGTELLLESRNQLFPIGIYLKGEHHE